MFSIQIKSCLIVLFLADTTAECKQRQEIQAKAILNTMKKNHVILKPNSKPFLLFNLIEILKK